jgi:hypothetical protein
MKLTDDLFPDEILDGAILFNKPIGGGNYVECNTAGNTVTVSIGGRTAFGWAMLDGRDLDQLIDTLIELQTQRNDLLDNEVPLDLRKQTLMHNVAKGEKVTYMLHKWDDVSVREKNDFVVVRTDKKRNRIVLRAKTDSSVDKSCILVSLALKK